MEDLLNEFVAEAKEHLEQIEQYLLEMERHPGVPYPEVISEIFRSVHSIKGACGFLGLKKIGELSHIMETLMSMIRSGEIIPESHHIDALLKGRDKLSAMFDDVTRSDQADIEPVVAVINTLIQDAASPKISKQIRTRLLVKDTLDKPTGLEVSEFDLINVRNKFDHLFLLEYDLSVLEKETGLSPVALVRELLSAGEILDTKLGMENPSLDQDLSMVPFHCKTLYTTNLDYELVKMLTGLSDEHICEVKGGTPTQLVLPQNKPEKRQPQPPSDVVSTSEPSIRTYQMDEKIDSVRISVEVLDKLMRLAGELVLVRNQHLLSTANIPELRDISQRLNIVTSELQETIMQTRMQPISNIFNKAPRIVRDLSQKFNKRISLSIHGGEVELDKAILESLTDPLVHLVRNCCDHGIESSDERKSKNKAEEGRIEIHAWHEAGRVNIRIHDDGRGIDPVKIRAKVLQAQLKTESELEKMSDKEILFLIFTPGFSTAGEITDVSGRGVGLDVVKTSVEKLGGMIELDSEIGKGSTFLLKLPLTLAIIPCIIVVSGEYRYAIPQVSLEELVTLYDRDVLTKIELAGTREVYRLRDKLLPIVRLNEVLGRKEPFTGKSCAEIAGKYHRESTEVSPYKGFLKFVVVKSGAYRFGLIVDQITGIDEIVVKPMHPATRNLRIYSGATILGDGSVAMILNVEGIAVHAGLDKGFFQGEVWDRASESKDVTEKQTALCFTYGDAEQFAIPLPLIRRVERIPMNRVERVCNREFIAINGVSTFIVRLDEVLDVNPHPDEEEMSLILPKYIHRPVGILISKTADVVQTPTELNVGAYMADGLLGTAIVKGRMTLFPDIYRLIELAEPEWFAQRRQTAPPPADKKILLVEDTPFFRYLVKGYLEADKYIVVDVANGKEALDKLDVEPFDMIVSDLEMPVMDGFEMIRTIRSNPRYRNVPAIALTSLDSEKDRKKAEDSGFDRYHVKIDRELLLTHIAASF